MINLEHQRKHFENHVATLTDYGNIKILDFANPNSSSYRIRFLFEEDYCRLHISGDLGELIACNYNNMRFEKFWDFVDNTGYFKEKIQCHNRKIYVYDQETAKHQLTQYIEENNLLEYVDYPWCETEDDKLVEILDDILEDFSEENGIGNKGYDVLSRWDADAWEWAHTIGRENTGILDLYMLAFKLAMEQLNKTNEKETIYA